MAISKPCINWYWDLETRGLDGAMIVGAYVTDYTDTPTFFYSIEQFFREIDRSKNPIKLYAHNGGKFDNLDIIEFLKADGRKFKIIPINSSNLIEFKNKKNQTIKFYDSLLLLPASLKKLSEELGIAHPKEDYDVVKLNYYDEWGPLGLFIEMPIVKHYLMYDVLSLKEVIKEFYVLLLNVYKELNLTNQEYVNVLNKFTLAGISHKTLLNTVKLNFGEVCKNYYSKEIENFIRESYAGGRVEVFKTYAENFVYGDINSLYPFVMSAYEFPYGKMVEVKTAVNIKKFLHEFEYLGIVKVKVLEQPPEPAYLWVKEDGKLMFKNIVGYTNTYTSFEILEAEKLGYKFEYLEAIFHEKKGYLFKDFSETLYKKRLEAKNHNQNAFQYVLKILLNSSYGKFGQKRKVVELFDLEQMTEEEEINLIEKYESIEELNGFGIVKTENYSNRDVNPIYASFVTAYARHELFIRFKDRYDKLIYVDTDSLLFEGIEFDKKELNKKLGGLKVECRGKRGIFIGAKQYFIKTDDGKEFIKLKGIPSRLLNSYTGTEIEEMYKRVLKGETITFEFSRMLGFRESLRRKDTDKKVYRHTRKITKIVKRTVEEKRRIINGKDTEML